MKKQKVLTSVTARQFKQTCDSAISATGSEGPNGGITDVREEGTGRVQMRPTDLEKRVISVERAGKGPRRYANLKEWGIASQPLENLFGDAARHTFKIGA